MQHKRNSQLPDPNSTYSANSVTPLLPTFKLPNECTMREREREREIEREREREKEGKRERLLWYGNGLKAQFWARRVTTGP